jgi:hypothetical protein
MMNYYTEVVDYIIIIILLKQYNGFNVIQNGIIA